MSPVVKNKRITTVVDLLKFNHGVPRGTQGGRLAVVREWKSSSADRWLCSVVRIWGFIAAIDFNAKLNRRIWMKSIVVFGATSSIAQHVMRNFARDKASFFLVARNAEKLRTIAEDLKSRGAKNVVVHTGEYLDFIDQRRIMERLDTEFPDFDSCVVAYGSLPDQTRCQKSSDALQDALTVNFTSVATLVEQFAAKFEGAGAGTIAVIGSVAGDRGRQSNYVYGSAKGALALYLQGLRNRLFDSGVRVVTIKPGFVDTPMTSHLEQGPLFRSAESVGSAIYKALKGRADVVYVPWFWCIIMTIIRLIPEFVFKRLKL